MKQIAALIALDSFLALFGEVSLNHIHVTKWQFLCFYHVSRERLSYAATRITLCWIDIPYPFQWGVPTFKSGDAFTMMIASFVASVESTGVFHASARYGSATPVPPSVVSRGVGWLGIGTMLNAIFGCGHWLHCYSGKCWSIGNDKSWKIWWFYDFLLHLRKIWSNLCFNTCINHGFNILYLLWIYLISRIWISPIL